MLQDIIRAELRSKRKERRLSQPDVAHLVGLSPSMYQRIEGGYSKPNPDAEKKLLDLFSLPADYFQKAATQ